MGSVRTVSFYLNFNIRQRRIVKWKTLMNHERVIDGIYRQQSTKTTKLTWYSESCRKIRELFGTPEKCFRLLKLVWDVRKLFGTSKNFFKLKKLFWTSEKYLTLCKTVWDFQVLFKTSRTVSGFRGVFDTSEKCLRVLRTVWDFWELFQISKESLKAPRTVWDLREMYETFENCPRFSGYTVRKHCGKTNKIVKENSNPLEIQF